MFCLFSLANSSTLLMISHDRQSWRLIYILILVVYMLVMHNMHRNFSSKHADREMTACLSRSVVRACLVGPMTACMHPLVQDLSQAPRKRGSLPFLSGQARTSARRGSCKRELMQQAGKRTGNQKN